MSRAHCLEGARSHCLSSLSKATLSGSLCLCGLEIPTIFRAFWEFPKLRHPAENAATSMLGSDSSRLPKPRCCEYIGWDPCFRPSKLKRHRVFYGRAPALVYIFDSVSAVLGHAVRLGVYSRWPNLRSSRVFLGSRALAILPREEAGHGRRGQDVRGLHLDIYENSDRHLHHHHGNCS